ncbi:MAG: GNAT family N-acetyltransferase [Rhodanobacteraceae bacterium]
MDADFILSLTPRFVDFDLPKGRTKRSVLAAIRTEVEAALREASTNDHFFVATDARGRRAGFMQLKMDRDFFSGARACHVANIAVASAAEGHGVGRALLARAQRWARKHECRLMTLNVFPGNTRALVLYQRAGFFPNLLRMMKPINRT